MGTIKNKIITGLVALLLSACGEATNTELRCNDSDDDNPYVTGITYGVLPGPGTPKDNLGFMADECFEFDSEGIPTFTIPPSNCYGSNCGLNEFFCKYNPQTDSYFVAVKTYKCPGSCQDGVCLTEK